MTRTGKDAEIMASVAAVVSGAEPEDMLERGEGGRVELDLAGRKARAAMVRAALKRALAERAEEANRQAAAGDGPGKET